MRRALNHQLIEMMSELCEQKWVMGCMPNHSKYQWLLVAARNHDWLKQSFIQLTFVKTREFVPTNEMCYKPHSLPWDCLRAIETENMPQPSIVMCKLLAVNCDKHVPKMQRLKYSCRVKPRWLCDHEVRELSHDMRSQPVRLTRWKRCTLLPVELIQHIAADLFALTWV